MAKMSPGFAPVEGEVREHVQRTARPTTAVMMIHDEDRLQLSRPGIPAV